MAKEEPEKLLKMFEYYSWEDREGMIKDITSELNELGYSIKNDLDSGDINVICEHDKVCRTIQLIENLTGEWIFDISDDDSIKDRCQICRRTKIIKYVFDGDILNFWDEYDADDDEEIDLNELIDWVDVHNKALAILKDKFPKGTIFINTIEEG